MCHVCEIADFHLAHLSGILVDILLWSVGHRRSVQSVSSIIVGIGGSNDLNRLQCVIILLIYKFEIFSCSLLEEVEGGLGSLASLNLPTIHRSLLVHCHVKDRIRLRVATTWTDETFMGVGSFTLLVQWACLHQWVTSERLLNANSFILRIGWHISVVRVHSCCLLCASREIIRRTRRCHLLHLKCHILLQVLLLF